MNDNRMKRLETELLKMKLQHELDQSGKKLGMRPSAIADACRAAKGHYF